MTGGQQAGHHYVGCGLQNIKTHLHSLHYAQVMPMELYKLFFYLNIDDKNVIRCRKSICAELSCRRQLVEAHSLTGGRVFCLL